MLAWPGRTGQSPSVFVELVTLSNRRMCMRVLTLGSVLALAVCGCSTERGGAPSSTARAPTATTIVSVQHPTGSADVVLQVGDYHLGWGPDVSVSGPEIVVYGDGSLYAELFDGVKDNQPVWSRVRARLSEDQLQTLLQPGEDLPADPPQNTIAVDTFPILLVSASHRWEVNDPDAEPFAGYLTSLRNLVRSYATDEWSPERWVVRLYPSPTCTVTDTPSTESSYDAPVYPGLLDQFPIGTVACYPAP